MRLPFSHQISFEKPDPLGGGLREEIKAEQEESDAISLEEGLDEKSLSQYWQGVEQDVKEDPSWFRFDEDNE